MAVLKKIVPIFIFLLIYAAYIFTCSFPTQFFIKLVGGEKSYDNYS